ncbi:TIGR01906 family membrane protein [Pseudarthrobacter sp. NS4]|uniref:TIGR01906 family membrane protein n=1 Tax=Pseudarthrobacter sp. NS4 TaxID=2973976 RepID=UPI002161266C|nr:TIGR01906 family membrane protein [Pseudarthrobacter sp. NS4]
MKDETPARAKSSAPQPEPLLDTSADSDEPAFSWLTPAKKGAAGPDAGNSPAGAPSGPAGSTPATGSSPSTGSSPVMGESEAGEPKPRMSPQPESRADRKAAEAAAGPSGVVPPSETVPPSNSGSSSHDRSPVFREPLPTSALHVRPPEEEVERRNAERESAANAKPVAPRVMQVLLAISFPVVLLVLAVRAVTSPLFLWVEYNRPGFPGDGYGFSTDDRMTYGSYAVDYLSNWAGPGYLGDLVNRGGDKLFKDAEVSHMADVKTVILSSFGAGALLLLLGLIAVLYLRKRSTGGVRRGLFAGSIITLVLILGLGTLAVLGWQQFFTEFHRIFFADGSWTFSLDDTLIRLFPGQFWIDAGIVIAGLVLLTALVTLVLTWPTRRRRGLVREEPVEADQA